MRRLLLHWLVAAVALSLTDRLVSGVEVASIWALLAATLVYGALNAVLKPVLLILTLPLTLLTLGLFYLVLNGVLFALASVLVPGFTVDGFGAAFLGALIMSLLSTLLGALARPEPRER